MAKINHEKANKNKLGKEMGISAYADMKSLTVKMSKIPEHLFELKGAPKLPIQQAPSFKNFLREGEYLDKVHLIAHIFSIDDELKARKLLSKMKAALQQNETHLPWPMPANTQN